MTRPHLTFACELETGALQALFSDPAVIEDLQALDASVAIGLIDLSDGRAEAVRQLNRAGIPLVAWLLLPREQGYWFNADNAVQATARYHSFCRWTADGGLRWAAIGLDIEPDLNEMEAVRGGRAWPMVPRLLSRALSGERVRRARDAYRALVARIRLDGYAVESYQFPFLMDERRAGSTLLQRLAGVVDIQTDREVLMLYSSFMGPLGPAVLWSYGRDAQAIGVGSTGGGVDLGEALPVLDGNLLVRDLLLARRLCREILIFSLEGCVRQKLLPRLRALDWEETVALPPERVRQVELLRALLRSLLWIAARPALAAIGLFGLIWLGGRLRRAEAGPIHPQHRRGAAES